MAAFVPGRSAPVKWSVFLIHEGHEGR